MAISGVFTGPQKDVMLKALDRRKGTTLHLFEPEKLPVADGKAEFALSGYKPGRKIVVKPTVGPEGHTVDLEISIPSAISDKGDIRTSITLWDGQAAVLSGVVSEDEKGAKTSWLFITTKIIREKKAESK